MSTLMIVLLIVSAINSGALAFVIAKDWEGWTLVLSIILGCTILFGWVLAGTIAPVNTTCETIPKNKVNIVTNSDKVFVTYKNSNETVIYEDARVNQLLIKI